MPSGGGAVYQPTTVSYEPRTVGNGIGNSNGGSGGGGPLGLIGQNSSMRVDSPLHVFRKPRPQVALFLFALIAIAAGIAMLGSGIADWLEAEEFERDNPNEIVSLCTNLPLGILLGGFLFITLGFIALGCYLKVADWRRKYICPCAFFKKKQSLVRHLQCPGSSGCSQGIAAMNPSTDPLVSHTQYATVSELPSLRADDEERRNLMPDNKDCLSSAEESDRMLEPDPRIVLRPIGRLEDA